MSNNNSIQPEKADVSNSKLIQQVQEDLQFHYGKMDLCVVEGDLKGAFEQQDKIHQLEDILRELGVPR